MNTDDLIARLAAAAEPVPAGPVAPRRFALPLGAGLIAAFVLTALGLGLAEPAAMAVAAGFWLKLVYGLGLGGVGLVLAAKLSRPGAVVSPVLTAAAPVLAALLLVIGLGQLLMADPGARMALLQGGSWTKCSRLILTVAVPVYAGAILAMRGLAPTRPALAGAAAGLAAGGLGSAVYALHCPEYAPAFIAVWYSLSIGLSTLAGAAVGWKVLRW